MTNEYGHRSIICLDNTFSVILGCYLYYINKYMDLVETIIFVLRKKQQQISMLHLYHHAMLIITCYLSMLRIGKLLKRKNYKLIKRKFIIQIIIYASGGTSIFIGTTNAFVHMVMYSYYFLSTYKPKAIENILHKIKKRVTQLQLVGLIIIN